MGLRQGGDRVPSPGATSWGHVTQLVMMELLKNRPTVASARDLARRLNLGHSKVAEITNFLLFHRALRETEGGLAVEWEQLAKLMGALRLPAIAPARTFGIAVSQADFHAQLDRAEIPHVFTFTTAANALAYFEPHPEICVSVAKSDISKVVEQFSDTRRIHALRTSPSLEAARTHPRILLFADKLDQLDVAESTIGTITSLHQTYIDLLHFPLAGAHVDVLKKAIERRWSRDHPDSAQDGRRAI